jgi:hypothetical protein
MNLRLGERACEADFLTVLVFCWIREGINLAACLHVSGPYRCFIYEFQENYPPRLSCRLVSFPPVPDRNFRCVLSSFLVVGGKEKNLLAVFSNLAIVALTP